MTTSQKILSLVSAVVALILVLVKLYWPALADPITQISVAVVACLAAVLAVTYPVTAAVGMLQRNHAAAIAVKRLPRVGDTQSEIDSVLASIYSSLDGDGIPYKKNVDGQTVIDNVPVAPRISRLLANSWNNVNVSMGFKLELLKVALDICSDAFKSVTNLKVPEKWSEVDDYNAFWRANQVSCAIHSEGLFRQVLMPLRTVLKIKDTGDI